MRKGKGLWLGALLAATSAVLLLTGWIYDVGDWAGEVLSDLFLGRYEQQSQ